MPFSFLNPWIWFGAIAIGAPIWLHLRRKKETNKVQFSAVRFLEDEPEPRRSPWRLRDLLLFALRALAVLLLVAAFAWPYLPSANMAPIKESRVYVLDNTLSHQANDGFMRDRNEILRQISQAGSDIQVAVVELAATPRVLVGFGTERQAARQRLQELEPSFQRGSYLSAFRLAASLVGNSLGDQKRILFFGDNQENQWSENVNTPPFLRNVQIDLPRTATASLANLSLSEPRIQRIFLGDKSLVNLTFKLRHAGDARTAIITVRGNEQTLLNRSVDLDKQPETMLLQAQWEADPAAAVRGEAIVEGQPDALAGDNRLFFALPQVVEGKVALLAQSPYLRLALSPDIMRGQWAARILEPVNLAAELAGTHDEEVLCIESSYLQSPDARKLVQRYLSNGRGVFLIVNRLTPAIDGCLRELGFEPDGVVQQPDSPEKFQFVLSNHPIFHPFLSPDYGNLMDIKFSQFVQLRPTAGMPLVFSESGAGLFFQGTRFPGKLFIAAFGLDREQTSWPIHQTFIPFLDLTLQAARAEDPTPTGFEPGEAANLQLAARLSGHEVVLRDAQHEYARATVEQGRAQLRMPNQPGIYELVADDGVRVEKVFSINPSPKESELAYDNSPEALKLWQLSRPEAPRANNPPAHERLRLSAILQQRLWWWMVLGGLSVLFLEMALAHGRKARA